MRRTLGERQIERIVGGGLKSCMKDHGPVNWDTLASAEKRISGQIIAELKVRGEAFALEVGSDAVIAELRQKEIDYVKRYKKAKKNARDLFRILQKHGISPKPEKELT